MTRAMKFMSLVMISLIGVLPLSVSPVQASTSIFLEDFGPSWVPGTQWSLAQSASFTAQVSTSGSETPNSALRLTSATTQKAGGLLYGTPIPTEFGLDIAFHFSMWGGSGADGINFFLQKGTETSSRMPAGGTLGYSADRNQNPNLNGLNNGLIGIGFDMYGNHSQPSFDGTGCPTSTRPGSNSLVVRGPGHLMAGYCILSTLKQVSDVSTPVNTKWDQGLSTRAGRARSVRIVLDPSTITPRQLKIWLCASGTECSVSSTPAVTIDAPAALIAEPTVRFGFAAATGGVTNNHEIWGLRIMSQIPITYSLSYDLGGGSGTLPASITGLSAGASNSLAAGTGLTRTGFTFDGWTCNNSIGDKSAGSVLTQPSASVVCTAKWTANPAAPSRAKNDSSNGDRGAKQRIRPLRNDTPAASSSWKADSLRLCGVNQKTPNCTLSTLKVDGEGTYAVNSKNEVTFTPDSAFVGKATAVRYQVADSAGSFVSADIRIVVSGGELPRTGNNTLYIFLISLVFILTGSSLKYRMFDRSMRN